MPTFVYIVGGMHLLLVHSYSGGCRILVGACRRGGVTRVSNYRSQSTDSACMEIVVAGTVLVQ